MLSKKHTPGGPRGADRRTAADAAAERALAVLSRTNHDMRSPLSVILGVFELLEESPGLDDGERRYLALGSEAADNLLHLADALRLHTALERGQVSFNAAPLDLPAMALDILRTAFQAKGAAVTLQPRPAHGPAQALADGDHLRMALTALAGHLASRADETDELAARHLTLNVRRSGGQVVVQVVPAGDAAGALPADGPADTVRPGVNDLNVVNAACLIELMQGTVNVDPEGRRLTISLPAAAASL